MKDWLREMFSINYKGEVFFEEKEKVQKFADGGTDLWNTQHDTRRSLRRRSGGRRDITGI